MKRFKSLSALFLALVLALSLSVTAFAATGNNTITSITAKGEAFTITAFAYTGQNGSFTDYSCHHEFANITNSELANLALTVTYSGGTLKNGTTTYTGGGTVTTNVNVINRVAELTLTSTNGVTETYYIGAWKTGTTFYASVSVEFSTANDFYQTATNTKYVGKAAGATANPYMQATTAKQRAAAGSAYQKTNAAFNGNTSATYNGLSYGYTAADIITQICTANNVYISNSSGYISQIGALNQDTAGQYVHPQWGGPYGSGGWMFKVLRGSGEIYPSISAGSFYLMPGDVVTWQYTADVGYDLCAPMF